MGLAPGFVQVMGLPALLWFVTAAVLGIVQTATDRDWARSLFRVVQLRALPVVFVLCSVAVVVHFFRLRAQGPMTKRERGDHRFVVTLLTIMCIFGAVTGFVVPLVVCALCRLAVQVRTAVGAPEPVRATSG